MIQQLREEPFELRESPAPGHLQSCIIWLPGEAGWSSIASASDWRRALSRVQAKLTTTEIRAQAWTEVVRALHAGYDRVLETHGAEGGAELAFTAGLAACLRPDGGKLIRRQLGEELGRPGGGARLIMLVSPDREYVATMVQASDGKQVLQ